MRFKPDLNQPTPKPHAATYAGTSHEPLMHASPPRTATYAGLQSPPHGNIRRTPVPPARQHTPETSGPNMHASLPPPARQHTPDSSPPRAANTPEPIMKQSCTAHQNPEAITEFKSTCSDRSTWITSYTAETQKVSNNLDLVNLNHI